MINRLLTGLSYIGVALALGTVPTYSATVTFTDATAWAAATNGNTTIDFTGLANMGSFVDYGTSTGLTSSGVQFLGYVSPSAFQLAVMDSMFAMPFYNYGGGATLRGPGYDSQNASFIPYVHVVLPGDVTAIAANLASISPGGLTYSVTLSDGETFTTPTGSRPDTTFFGLTTDASISYIDFALSDATAGNGSFGLIKTFQFGATAAGVDAPPPTGDTPEACTMILIGTGLVALRAMKKYKGAFGMQQV